MNDLLRPSEIATLLGVTPSNVYKMIEQKRLPFVRTGRMIRIPRAAYEAWLAEKTMVALAALETAALAAVEEAPVHV